MPVVPTYRSQGVTSQALPDVRVPTSAPLEAFGGGEANQNVFGGVSKFAENIGRVAAEEKKSADDTLTQQSTDKITTAANDLLWNPKTGAMTKQGNDALGIIDSYVPEFDKAAADIREKSLQNEDQRKLFDHIVAEKKNAFTEQLNKRVGQATQEVQTDTLKAGIAVNQSDAVLNYMEPNRIGKSIDIQKALITDYASKAGIPMGSDQYKLMIADAESKTHSGVITRMLDNNQDLQAQAYYDQVKGHVLGGEAAVLEKQLKLGSLKGESQRQSDAIMSQGLGYTEARAKAKEIDNPEVRSEVLKNIDVEFTAKEKAQKINEETIVQNLTKDILNRGADANLPITKISKLHIKKKKAVRYFKLKESAGENIPPNSPTYLQLSLMSHDPNKREDFANRDIPSETLNRVSTQERKELIDSWLKIREKDEIHTEFLNYQNENDKIVQDTMDKIGKSHWYSLGGLSDQEAVNFRVSIGQAINQKEKALKRNLSADETKEIVNRYATNVVTGGGLFGNAKKPLGTINPDEVTLSAIPADIQSQARESLRARGLDPKNDEQNIIKLYVEALKAGRIKPSGE